MTEPREIGPSTCATCGATASRVSSRYCEYCGAELPRTVVPQPVPSSPFDDVEGRFRALEQHPDLAALMERTPAASMLVGQTVIGVFVLVFIACVGLLVAGLSFLLCPPLGLVPLALLGIAVWAIGKQIARTSSASAAPLQRLPALVREERADVVGSDRHQRTSHHATLQWPDGERRELDTLGRVAGRITPGDMGIAYVKGDWLIDFARVDV